MRLFAVSLALGGFLAAASPLHAQGRKAALPPGWCIDPEHRPDSTFFARQAIGALSDSVTRRLGFELKVNDYQIIKTSTLEQGVIVSVVVARPPVLGGGGLVWVDLETGCPIVLRRYE